jgi:excinuclease UvrABC nuclease subunit
MLQRTMTIEDWKWYPLTPDYIDLVTEGSGVYSLGVDSNMIYIGSSVNLHQRLTEHYHSTDFCIRRAKQFAIQPCMNYREKEKELLEWFLSEYGRLPDCNDRL